ncbi:MAG: GNAT family N-acetyltransferase [Acetobacteraceae bacterium]|nr:GNAT family N-acetyltransferase [Acetobacteraceae bacterium]
MAVIRKPGTLDLAQWKALLASEKMRTEELGAGSGFWLVAHESGQLVGGAGLEFGGDSALLRSLVVAVPLRGRGLGQALLDALAEEAGRRGAVWLYALSSEAPKFLLASGFRETTPDEVEAALPEAPLVALYRRLKWLPTERAFRRDLAPASSAA